MIDDLTLKTKKPNHLATLLEKQAHAGLDLTPKLITRLRHFDELTKLVQLALIDIIGETLSALCHVVYTNDYKITIALPTVTAANHIRYLKNECLQALWHYDERFLVFTELNIVVNSTQVPPNLHRATPKKPLSENTVRTITQYMQDVITNESLRQGSIHLIQSAKVKDDTAT